MSFCVLDQGNGQIKHTDQPWMCVVSVLKPYASLWRPQMTTDPKAADMVQDMVADPTLDQFFDRNPATLTDDDFRKLIEIERVRRAEFITAESGK